MRGNPRTLEQQAEDEFADSIASFNPSRGGLKDELVVADSRNPESQQRDASPSLIDRFSAQLTTFSDDELEAAKQPHPHAFEQGDCGLFPLGEVSVIAAPGREGKTFASVALSVAYTLGTRVVGLAPPENRCVIIYSAEDDRKQYARKVLAQLGRLGESDARRVREGLFIPDLSAAGMESFCSLVRVANRRPIESAAIGVVIKALRPEMASAQPPGLLIFETASTLSEGDEDNQAFKTLIMGLRRIARELGVAVVLMHHTSQQAQSNLTDLNLSVADIRGGTALVFNARQCFLLANLGSCEDPLPGRDARSVLRQMAAPNATCRVTALICLDSSKGIDPPPVFFQWASTQAGPALSVVSVPPALEGVRWQKLHQMLRAQRAGIRRDAKYQTKNAIMQEIVNLVIGLDRAGIQPTARAVSRAARKSDTYSRNHLDEAVTAGHLSTFREHVPRTKGLTTVYRPTDSTQRSSPCVE